MAVIDWPIAFGYAEFSEMPYRVRGPFVHRSVFTGTPHVSYGGGRRRRGYIVTPVSRTGAVQIEITALVQQLSDPDNQIRLTLPRPGGMLTLLTGNVIRISPPERDDRGTWRGWRLEFVELGTADDTLPMPITIRTVSFLSSAIAVDEGDTGVLTVRTTLDAPVGGLTVQYVVSGTATSGDDYTALSGSVVIPVGQRMVEIPIVVTDDADTEAAETIILTLTATADYEVGVLSIATVTIGASDPVPIILPMVSFMSSGITVNEGDTGVLTVLTTLDAPAGGLMVEYVVSGTATAVDDYTALSGSVIIPVGERMVEIPIAVTDDADVEAAETIILTLTDTGDYDLGTAVIATVTIGESDQAVSELQVRIRGVVVQYNTIPPVPDGHRIHVANKYVDFPAPPYVANGGATLPAFVGGMTEGSHANIIDMGYRFVAAVRDSSVPYSATFDDSAPYLQRYVTVRGDDQVSEDPAGVVTSLSNANGVFTLGAPPAGVETILLAAHYLFGSIPPVLPDSQANTPQYLSGFAPNAMGVYTWTHHDLNAGGYGYRYYAQYLNVNGRGSAVVSIGTKDP